MKNSETISTNDLRFNFARVLKAIEHGQKLTLTYRNKPLAVILPYVEANPVVDSGDPIYHLGSLAQSMGALSNEEIDRELYGE